MSLATMLIESAALYGGWSLAFLILYILQSVGQTIILATMSQIQVSRLTAWALSYPFRNARESNLNKIASDRLLRHC